MKNVTVRVTLPADIAAELNRLSEKDDAINPRPLRDTLAWLGRQAVVIETVNPIVPIMSMREALNHE